MIAVLSAQIDHVSHRQTPQPTFARDITAILLSLAAFSAAHSAGAEPVRPEAIKPIDLNKGVHLLLDDYLIARIDYRRAWRRLRLPIMPCRRATADKRPEGTGAAGPRTAERGRRHRAGHRG